MSTALKRKIIKIDEDKCNGCGDCIPNCPEGAIRIIDGKARLISDLFCDGLGACLGHCPLEAITVEEREAEPYNEKKVMENVANGGENVIKAHLEHLRDHGENELFKQAVEYLKENKLNNPLNNGGNKMQESNHSHPAGCPGSKMMNFTDQEEEQQGSENGSRPSQLKQWPIQLHLVSPMAPYYQGKDVLLAADCTAFAIGDFHKDYLKSRSLAIACPKLDDGQETYIEKITALIDQAKINTLTVLIMQVPCCSGLLQITQQAVEKATRKVPVKSIVVDFQGKVLQEEWL